MEAVILIGLGDHRGLAPAVFLDCLGDMTNLVIAVLEAAVGLAALSDLAVDPFQGAIDLIIGNGGLGLVGIDDLGQVAVSSPKTRVTGIFSGGVGSSMLRLR